MSGSAKRRWTKEDDQRLVWYWGSRRPEAVAKLLGRSVEACRLRVHKLTGRSSSRRGIYSQSQLARETGYNRADIRRAAAALNIMTRAQRNQAWRINEDQRERILDYLATEEGSFTGVTVREAATDMGVRHETVLDWCRRLGIDHKKGRHIGQLTGEEVERVRTAIKRSQARKTEVISGKSWALKHDCCTRCGTDERPHKAKGMCLACYTADYRKRGS